MDTQNVNAENYKIEDLAFYNEVKINGKFSEGIYSCERHLSDEEKVAFIDKYYEKNGLYGWASYILDVMNKFENDSKTMPKDSMGYVKTVSLKAWLKRNDPRKVFDDYWHYGNYYFINSDYMGTVSKIGRSLWGYGKYEGEYCVHEWFNDFCNYMYYKEKKYFLEHDEVSLKIAELENMESTKWTCFNNDKVNDILFNHDTDVTVEQLDKIISYYKKLEDFEKQLSDEFQM